MNCKPGDLAVVVRTHSNATCLLGRVIVVGAAAAPIAHLWHWHVDPPLIDPRDGKEWVLADSQLRPIRDPGDDAVDETLQRLPAPKQDTVWQPKRQVENA